MHIRALVGAIIGIWGGAGAGAITLGWDASMAAGSSFIGPTRDWWPLATIVGALGGAVFGLALGLYISLAGVGARTSAVAGSGVGVIGVLVMFSTGENMAYWRLRSAYSRVAPIVLSLIIWATLGLLLSAVASKLSHAKRG